MKALAYACSAGLALLSSQAWAAAPLYSLTLLNDSATSGIFFGGPVTFPWAINSSGTVVGAVGGQAAIITDHGFVSIAPPGTSGSYARGINDKGQIVIESQQGSTYFTFLYENGAFTQLVGPYGSNLSAYGINNSGDIAGGNYWAPYQSYGIVGHSGSYSVGGSYLIGINDLGQATGTADRSGAIIVDSTGTHNIGTLGGTYALGWDINNLGQVAGQSDIASGRQMGFVYQNGIMSPIAHDDWRDAIAYSLNDSGIVVGDAETTSGSRQGWVYSDGSISMLNDVILNRGSFDVRFVRGINEFGQIVGLGYDAQTFRSSAFVLTPASGVPEPSTWATMLLGFAFVGGALRSATGNRRADALT